jgi:hypothetical protein
MWSRVLLLGAILSAVGCRGTTDAKSRLLGTWTRTHEGRVVQEKTFADDGKYHSFNPATGGAQEHGNYTVAPDGKSVTFNGTDADTKDSATYTVQVRFNGKDEFVETIHGNEWTFRRKG